MTSPIFLKRTWRKTWITATSLGGLITFLLLLWGSGWTTASASRGVPASPTASAFQSASPWTAVASTGAVDESASAFYAFTDACVEYRRMAASLDPIQVRYNVVNTFDNGASPTVPGWTNMELGFAARGGSVVEARLFKVDLCTGQQSEICRITGKSAPNPTCQRCPNGFPAAAINFAENLYYVLLTVDRAATTERPRACTLRLR